MTGEKENNESNAGAVYGLIGYPLGHSFSLPYFTQKFGREEVDASYHNFPMEDISRVRELPELLPGLAGLNITIPHKKAVIAFLDDLDPVAEGLGAVNTISIRREGGKIHMKGFNTDVIGFGQSLQEHLQPQHNRALVLGTGGSSAAVCHVLGELGIDFRQVSRTGKLQDASEILRGSTFRAPGNLDARSGDVDITPGNMETSTRDINSDAGARDSLLSYDSLSEELMHSFKLVINTTPLGMYPKVEHCPDLPYDGMGPEHLLFDLVYNPAETLFLRKGMEKGARVVNGYDMLVYQAEASWQIWNSY